MTWERLPQVSPGEAGIRSGCLTCGPIPATLPLDAVLCVGYGLVWVTLDDADVWIGDDERLTLGDVEAIAARYADHDWRVIFYGPRDNQHYQRQGDARWVLVTREDYECYPVDAQGGESR